MTPEIQVHSGSYFDFTNPENSIIRIEDIAHALSNLCRFTGHTREFYSIAEHSVLVACMVPDEYALQALLHDAAEAYIGDVSAPLKMLLPGYRKIEKQVERAVFSKFGLPSKLHTCVKQADLEALAIEQRDLMPPGQWDGLKNVKLRDDFYVQAWQPADAYDAFMEAYHNIIS